MTKKQQMESDTDSPVRKEMLEYFQASLGNEEIDSLVETIQSGWLTYGPKSREFENNFAKYVGSKYAIAVNSCTAGLHLSLLAVGVKQGDEVITTPYTFAATSEVILQIGAKPVFVDINDTLNIDASKIEDAINENTKAILPVHFAGQPCDMDAITKLSKKYNLDVVEDAAHAAGSAYKGKNIGTISKCTAFSFYANKNMTTGEGGIVTTNDPKIAEKIRILSLHGISKDAWKRFSSKGNWYYEILEAGYKYNFTDIQASIGIHQLQKLEVFNERRRELSTKYLELFSNNDLIKLPNIIEDVVHTWHLFPIFINFKHLSVDRVNFMELLEKEGIKTSVHYIPLHLHPYYKNRYGYESQDFPKSFDFYSNEISLPIYPKMKDSDLKDVVNSVNKLIKKYKLND